MKIPYPGNIRERVQAIICKLLQVPCMIFFLILLLSPPLKAETLDRVVATVNNEVITLSELEESVSLYTLQLGNLGKGQPSAQEQQGLQRRILEELINKKLIDEFAVKSGIQASDEEVDRAIQDVVSRNKLTKEKLETALKQDNLSYDEYRKQIQDQIVKMKLINREVRPNVNVSDDAVREYYLSHPEKFRTEQGVMLNHILFRVPKNPDEKTFQDIEKKARLVREEILKGKPFEEAAQQYSQDEATAMQGGALGFFKPEELIPEFKTVVARLKEGEVSEPIRTSRGVYLMKLDERTTGTVRPFEKVKEDIRSRLFEDQGERYFQDWIKDLRKNAYIEILL